MNEINFEEIKKIVDSFPELPKRERSMIEIGGYRNDENVNSDYLAFFLREDEEHNLGCLFFDALLKVLKLDIALYQGDYEVKRELTTKKGNRIDIVIQSKDKNWAIIIENKIYHYLNNDLQDYWDSVDVKNKKGVILSLKEEHQTYHNDFKNITHEVLINRVKEKLGQKITSVNPKFLPFLQDFILNVENYYFYDRADVKEAYQDRLMYFYKNGDKKVEVIKDIDDIFRRQLENLKFKTNGAKDTDYWLYYDNKENFQIYYYRQNILGKDKLLYVRLSIKDDLFNTIKDKKDIIEKAFSDSSIKDKVIISVQQKTEKNKDPKLTQVFTVKHKIKVDTNYVKILNKMIEIIGETILPKLTELISKK